jgi:hypothetical protein
MRTVYCLGDFDAFLHSQKNCHCERSEAISAIVEVRNFEPLRREKRLSHRCPPRFARGFGSPLQWHMPGFFAISSILKIKLEGG